MYKTWVAGVAACIGLAGWTDASGAGLFSAQGPVIAILGDELFLGEAEGHLSGAGTLAIRSQESSAVSCLGEFTSSAKLGGSGQMKCSDGGTGTFHFKRLSLRSGYGAGSSSRGPMSFTYGLTAPESADYLNVPAGKKLVSDGDRLELVDSSPQAVVLAQTRVKSAAPVARAIRVAQAVEPAQRAVAAEPALAQAQDVGPDVLLKTITSEVIAVMKQDESIQDNPAKVSELVDNRILPHFDLGRMTQLAMGRNWGVATAEQQKLLTVEFKTLLVRTYSNALASYRDQVIEYSPLRAATGATEVTVKSSVKQPGRERVTIDYDMEKMPAGWKVYDIKLGGISLITTYRETFAGKVRDGGIEGLIRSLSDKNRQSLKTAGSGR